MSLDCKGCVRERKCGSVCKRKRDIYQLSTDGASLSLDMCSWAEFSVLYIDVFLINRNVATTLITVSTKTPAS